MKRDNLTKLRVPLGRIEAAKEIGVSLKNSAKRVRRSGAVSKVKLNNWISEYRQRRPPQECSTTNIGLAKMHKIKKMNKQKRRLSCSTQSSLRSIRFWRLETNKKSRFDFKIFPFLKFQPAVFSSLNSSKWPKFKGLQFLMLSMEEILCAVRERAQAKLFPIWFPLSSVFTESDGLRWTALVGWFWFQLANSACKPSMCWNPLLDFMIWVLPLLLEARISKLRDSTCKRWILLLPLRVDFCSTWTKTRCLKETSVRCLWLTKLIAS